MFVMGVSLFSMLEGGIYVSEPYVCRWGLISFAMSVGHIPYVKIRILSGLALLGVRYQERGDIS